MVTLALAFLIGAICGIFVAKKPWKKKHRVNTLWPTSDTSEYHLTDAFLEQKAKMTIDNDYLNTTSV